MDYQKLLSQRTLNIEASGIRKIFDLAATVKNAVNLSIGQPDYDVPEVLKEAANSAIRGGRNGYPPSPGLPELRKLVLEHYRHSCGSSCPEDCLITSGGSGGLTLALLALVNPGDEVLIPDPYFVSYKHLTTICGGTKVFYDTYPHFSVKAAEIEKLVTPRTKVLLVMSPGNPTGAALTTEEKRGLADLARRKNLIIISDEVYEIFWYGQEPNLSLSAFYPEGTLAVSGLTKTAAMTGWRLGWTAGPRELIAEMIKLQQFTFVCAPSTAQYSALKAFTLDHSKTVQQYRQKRDFMLQGLRQTGYECEKPGGAFYLFPQVPRRYENAQKFVEAAIKERLLLVPGNSFSARDTHFRISFAAPDQALQEGLEILRKLNK
jgi:aspartate aminotransferase/aminotransferase